MKQATPARQPPVTATEAISAAMKLEEWLYQQKGQPGCTGWTVIVRKIHHAARKIRDKGI